MKIAFGVFDWGLGHATRDIPLISELIKENEVHIISTGRALHLLKGYYGDKCKFFDVPSIHVPYPKNNYFALSFVKNAPKMMYTLKRARRITEQIINKENYDKVISDCRFDVYGGHEDSYLINHQLRFAAFVGAEGLLERWLESRMKKYKFILVPDFEKPNLSGKLSHNLTYLDKSKIKYIGILSQLKKQEVKEDIDLFVSISGPEPQRTVLEEKILPMLGHLHGNIVVALGKPESDHNKFKENIKFCGFLDSKNQEDVMNRAKFIITRSGYTTIMELAELNKRKVLMIPTPGQTEQEYLSKYYKEEGYFNSVSQSKLNLKEDIKNCKGFKGFNPPWKTQESVKKFIEAINT